MPKTTTASQHFPITNMCFTWTVCFKSIKTSVGYLTFIEETADGVSLQQRRVSGDSVHICDGVIQVQHVLRRLFVSSNQSSRRIIHPKHLQKPPDGLRAHFFRLASQVIHRRSADGESGDGDPDHRGQHADWSAKDVLWELELDWMKHRQIGRALYDVGEVFGQQP